ncbi:MAG: hypothetical protein O3A45_02880 [Proteobacteria bacterium]|jgi:hypothetical protein|nr:hypothetical protein [Pseudomonadota bacterium]
MTYKAKGSMLMLYLHKIGLRPIFEQSPGDEAAFLKQARRLVTVKSLPSLEKINFSYTGQSKGQRVPKYSSSVSTSLKNLMGRELKGIPSKSIIITCAKELWFHKGRSDTKRPKTEGFSKNSRMFNVNWIANTTKGTNNYAPCSTLIYLYDQHPNPLILNWLRPDHHRTFVRDYALAELIQWVCRSRIRNGEPITVYIPSRRMREIFSNWLNSLEYQDH